MVGCVVVLVPPFPVAGLVGVTGGIGVSRRANPTGSTISPFARLSSSSSPPSVIL